jgi:hypothetical protein
LSLVSDSCPDLSKELRGLDLGNALPRLSGMFPKPESQANQIRIHVLQLVCAFSCGHRIANATRLDEYLNHHHGNSTIAFLEDSCEEVAPYDLPVVPLALFGTSEIAGKRPGVAHAARRVARSTRPFEWEQGGRAFGSGRDRNEVRDGRGRAGLDGVR